MPSPYTTAIDAISATNVPATLANPFERAGVITLFIRKKRNTQDADDAIEDTKRQIVTIVIAALLCEKMYLINLFILDDLLLFFVALFIIVTPCLILGFKNVFVYCV